MFLGPSAEKTMEAAFQQQMIFGSDKKNLWARELVGILEECKRPTKPETGQSGPEARAGSGILSPSSACHGWLPASILE